MQTKFYSVSEFIDIESGEVLNMSKERVLKNYQIIKKTKKTEKNENRNIVTTTYINECRRMPEQGTLFA